MTLEDATQILPLLIFAIVVSVLRWNLKRVPDWGPARSVATLQRDAEGLLVVPVSQIVFRRRWGGSHNGLTPRLWITPTGLRFKVFQLTERAFDDFTQVDARKTLFQGTRLIFVGEGEWVHALIRDRALARAVLRHLPPSLPLSPAAAALRGEVPHPALSQEPPHWST